VFYIELLLARDIHHINTNQRARHFRESHVEINTHFLIPARIHKQLGLHILCKVKVELGCKEREHQHTSYDRHGSTRKRFDSKILQRFGVCIEFLQSSKHC